MTLPSWGCSVDCLWTVQGWQYGVAGDWLIGLQQFMWHHYTSLMGSSTINTKASLILIDWYITILLAAIPKQSMNSPVDDARTAQSSTNYICPVPNHQCTVTASMMIILEDTLKHPQTIYGLSMGLLSSPYKCLEALQVCVGKPHFVLWWTTSYHVACPSVLNYCGLIQ